MSALQYYLALNRIPQLGPRTFAKLIKQWPEPEFIFKATITDLQALGLSLKVAEAIRYFDFKQVEADFAWAAAEPNRHLISLSFPEYPSLLKEIAAPPFVLYAEGQVSIMHKSCIAIIGSRNASPLGSENAYAFAKALSAQGLVIVSGLALGIDGQAHQGCLDADGETIAVLGTGIDCVYPKRHQCLAEQIKDKGLLLSEFPLKSGPCAQHFPLRNRIISGLSSSVLVIEASLQSGSLITARMALEQNREVLAIPGSIHNPLARGCHHLLQQGAKLVGCVQDILEEMPHFPHKVRKVLPAKGLLAYIDYELTPVDKIVLRSGYTLEQVLQELADLELHGAVYAFAGGYVRAPS